MRENYSYVDAYTFDGWLSYDFCLKFDNEVAYLDEDEQPYGWGANKQDILERYMQEEKIPEKLAKVVAFAKELGLNFSFEQVDSDVDVRESTSTDDTRYQDYYADLD